MHKLIFHFIIVIIKPDELQSMIVNAKLGRWKKHTTGKIFGACPELLTYLSCTNLDITNSNKPHCSAYGYNFCQGLQP
jgi:hypothetical protein